ncbi:hypothetical protein EYR41_000107 [Orbilia oligospora]|uniref:Uncharacterized protein n=1 Tax=Orbilia oligospora TaxID=2813651 RepID=A0A8H2E9J3_ORBOL|nr:hypothetical protein EYR41_000107 [Orbilia oligospora]
MTICVEVRYVRGKFRLVVEHGTGPFSNWIKLNKTRKPDEMRSGASHLHVIIIIYVLHDVYEALEQLFPLCTGKLQTCTPNAILLEQSVKARRNQKSPTDYLDT